VLLRVLPLERTVGISPSGEGTEEGANPLPAGGYLYVPPQSPRPQRGGSTWGYPRIAVSRDANPGESVKKKVDTLLR
ncbi:hypothetical protein KH990_08925, partial [Methanoculleus bourgensis]|uniref:hypothetical protein n=1 Tax=Methanoculleus bourgensis TaxID=83986 RepID=UPI001BDB01DD